MRSSRDDAILEYGGKRGLNRLFADHRFVRHASRTEHWLKVKTGAGREARSGRRLGTPMSDDDKIYVDAEQPATLNNGAGKLTDYRTLQEAAMAWHRLPPQQTRRATIKVIGGPVYNAAEIVRFHYGPRPA